MNYKQLEKLSCLYLELKGLDSEIIQLDKIALLIAENGCLVDLRMTVINKPKTEKAKVLDSDGSLIKDNESDTGFEGKTYIHRMLMGYGVENEINISKKVSPELDERINDISALQIIGVLLSRKNEKRTKIVSQIKELL